MGGIVHRGAIPRRSATEATMVRSLIAGSVALSLVGCLHTQVPVEGAPGAPVDVPLEARIWPSAMGGGDFVSLRLSKPAYVAVFQIIPGGGTQLLYPRYGQSRQLAAGNQFAHILGRGTGSAYRAASLTSRHMSRYGYGLGVPHWTQPIHFFLVASEEPLNLDAVQSSADGGFGLLSTFRFSSFSSNAVMEALLSHILPASMDANWVTDVYTYFPEPPAPPRIAAELRTTQTLWLTCAGTTVEVPPGMPLRRINAMIRSGCTVAGRPPQEPVPTAPIDTSGVSVPGQMKLPRAGGTADTVGQPVRTPLGRTEAPPRIAISDQARPPGVVERTREAELRANVRAGDRAERTRSFVPEDGRRPVSEAQSVTRPLGRVAQPTEGTRASTPQARERERAAPSRPRAVPERERPRAQPTRERPRVEPARERPRAEPARERPRAEPARERPRAQPTRTAEPPRRAAPPRAEPTRKSVPPKSSEPPKRPDPDPPLR